MLNTDNQVRNFSSSSSYFLPKGKGEGMGAKKFAVTIQNI
jgi:hypothetical protein